MTTITKEELFEAIMRERDTEGIRSSYPKYYVWEAQTLWLVGSVGIYNMGMVGSSYRDLNREVARLLDAEGIAYRFQNVIWHSSNNENQMLFSSGKAGETLRAMKSSLLKEQEIKKPSGGK